MEPRPSPCDAISMEIACASIVSLLNERNRARSPRSPSGRSVFPSRRRLRRITAFAASTMAAVER